MLRSWKQFAEYSISKSSRKKGICNGTAPWHKWLWKIYTISFAGVPIDKVALLDQDTCNYVGKKLLEITLMELFIFRFMQACSPPRSVSLSLSLSLSLSELIHT